MLKSIALILRVCLLAVALTLIACTSGQNSDPAAAIVEGDELSTPEGEGNASEGSTGTSKAGFLMTNQLDEGLVDDDGDGIPNSLDVAPDQPPALIVGENALTLSGLGLWNEQDEQWFAEGIVVAGQPLRGQFTNHLLFPGPYLALWYSEAGVEVSNLEVDDSGVFLVDAPENIVRSIQFVAGEVITAHKMLESFPTDAAVLAQVGEAIVGETVSLKGFNVSKLEGVKLDSVSVPFAVQNNMVEVSLLSELSSVLTSNLLTWESQGRSYQLALDLEKYIEVDVDQTIQDPSEWSVFNDSGVIYATNSHAPWNASTLKVAVSPEPLVISFYHADYQTVSAIVWPGESSVTLGVESTVQSFLLKQLQNRGVSDAALLREVITSAFELDSTQALVADLESLHQGMDSALAFNRLETELEALTDQLVALVAAADSRSDLGGVARSSQTQPSQKVFDYLTDTFDAISDAQFMYSPIVSVLDLQAEAESGIYSSLTIARYRNLARCGALTGLVLPNGIWPSDLCVANAGIYYASAKVVDGITEKTIKNHVKEVLDLGLIGPNGTDIFSLRSVGYLTADDGSPLCHMRPCEIEIITGGFGFRSNVTLVGSELNVQDITLGRTIIEHTLFPAMAQVLQLPTSDPSVKRCAVTYILSSLPGGPAKFALTVAEFKGKVDTAASEADVLGAISDVLVPYAFDLAVGMLTPTKLPACFTGALRNQLLGRAADLAKELGENVAKPIQIASAILLVLRGADLITTREKFTLQVIPRALIFDISANGDEEAFPELKSIDDNGYLTITGASFTYLLEDGSYYLPRLKVADRFGNSETLRLTEQNRLPVADASGVAVRVTVPELRPLMANLEGEFIDVSLIVDDEDYSEFTAEGLPLPGREIRWETIEPKLTGKSDNIIKRGQTLTLFGKNLNSFQSPDLTVTLTLSASPATSRLVTQGVEYISSEEIKFTVPDDLLAGVYDLELSTPSIPNNEVSLGAGVVNDNTGGSFLVLPVETSFLTIFDNGASADDELLLFVTDVNTDLVTDAGADLLISVDAGSAARSAGIFWSSTGVSSTPTSFAVSCESPNADGVCTWRVKGEVWNGNTPTLIDRSGKLADQEDAFETF